MTLSRHRKNIYNLVSNLQYYYGIWDLNIGGLLKFGRNVYNVLWLELIYIYTVQYYRKKHLNPIKKNPILSLRIEKARPKMSEIICIVPFK